MFKTRFQTFLYVRWKNITRVFNNDQAFRNLVYLIVFDPNIYAK